MTKVDIATAIAFKLYGTPYRWGGKDMFRGLDCSGFIQILLMSCGILEHSEPAINIDTIFRRLSEVYPACENTLSPPEGAIIFYGDSSKVTHGMYSLGLGLCIGAQGGGSSCDTVECSKSVGAFVKVLPASYRLDIVGVINPFK